jgi:predicted DNA-binding transcriptional regulator YafY
MYQPTTRLLTVLELLQARGSLTGPELAERLEVDRRSIRRYVTMLQDLGIPIEGRRGPAGGYRLRPGYKLPPLMFSDQEAVALTLALIAVPRLGLTIDPTAAAGALAKLERVLPLSARERVQAVQSTIAIAPGASDQIVPSDVVALLSHAAQTRQRVRLRHRTRTSEESERTVDPFGIVNLGRRWYLAGYCHLREDERVFRIDRISEATVLDEHFTTVPSAEPLEIVLRAMSALPGAHEVEVVLGTTLGQASRVISPTFGRLEEVEGGVLFQCRIDDLDNMAHFLIGFGWPLTIRKPHELRAAFARLANELMTLAASPAG